MSREIVLLVLLVLAAYRATRLIVKDTFPPVLCARDRLAGGWRKRTLAENREFGNVTALKDPEGTSFVTTEIDGVTNRWVNRSDWSPDWLAELITCPWCASAYVSGAVVLITDLSIGVQWPWLMGGAVWAGASLIASKDWA